MTPTSRAIAVVYEHTKRTQEMCSPIGHNNTKHFLCPIRSRHRLELLEMVRWESVPRGSSALTWKLSSRLFSRPDWLPLGLRGWCFLVNSRFSSPLWPLNLSSEDAFFTALASIWSNIFTNSNEKKTCLLLCLLCIFKFQTLTRQNFWIFYFTSMRTLCECVVNVYIQR